MADDLWSGLGYAVPQTQPTDDVSALKAMVAQNAPNFGIPADLADRWVRQESSYNPKATSKKGARGLTQLMPDTAKQYGVNDVEDPQQNINGGMQYLSELHAKYGDWGKALAAYNAGPDAVDKAGGVPNIPETQAYVKAILGTGEKPQDGGLWSSLGYTGATDQPDQPAYSADNPKMIKYSELNPADQKTYRTLYEGGALDPNAPQGSEHFPFFNTDPKQVPGGAYYVQNGTVKRAPGGAKESSAVAGLGQGAADVATSLMHLLPGSDDSDVKNTLLANQMLYGAKYGGDMASGAGRFTGQLAASAPLLAGGEAIFTPALAKVAPGAVAFLSGNAGAWKGADALSRLLRVGSLSAAGGTAGAGAAGLTASANPEPLPEQLASGFAGGALVGPVAPALNAVGGKAGELARSLWEPLRPSGQEQIVSRLLGDVSGGAPVRPNLTSLVPGSEPTLGEAAANAGVSALERSVRTNPRVAQRFAERVGQNNQARVDLFNSVAGDQDSLQALEAARDAATSGAREAALQSQTQLADVQPVLDKIDGILKGPEGKRKEVVSVLNDVRSNLHDAQGNPETSADLLYGVRKDINDLLSGKASKDRGAAQLAAGQLKAVRDTLDQSIEAVAPGFRDYLKTYADLSRPVDEQRYLQGLNLTNPASGKMTLSNVQRALDKIDNLRNQPGANEAKSISPDTYNALVAIRDDLKRESNITLGKAMGSDTVQNAVTEGISKAAGIPSDLANALGVHPKAGAVLGLGKLLYGSKNPQVLDRLATRLLEPGNTPMPVAPSQGNKLLRGARKVLTPPTSAVSGLLATRLLGTQ